MEREVFALTWYNIGMKKDRSVGETLVNVSRALDAGTVVLALAIGGPLAVVLLEGVVVTGAAGEIIDSAIKRSKKD